MCFSDDTDFNKIVVIAGTANLQNYSRTAQVRKVILVVLHEDYKGLWPPNQNYTADIALIKVSTPFTYNIAIQPIQLPEKGQFLKTSIGTIAGWGYPKVRIIFYYY